MIYRLKGRIYAAASTRLERADGALARLKRSGLSEEEQALVEIKLALADAVKTQREKHRLSQGALAARMKSSLSRVAKLEAGDPTVFIDLLVRAVLAAGATKKDLGKMLASL